MRVGLDFDNTIVCYDEAFFKFALEDKAIPSDLPHTKEKVKAHLQAQGRNDYWTALQGIAYGPRMDTAAVFGGFEDFVRVAARTPGVELFIVSHRSPKPYSGLDFDLHEAARKWLSDRPWVSKNGITPENIFFEPTLDRKIARIESLRLDYFVDDLSDVFAHPGFPRQTHKVHFSPSNEKNPTSWIEILRFFEGLWKKT